MKTTIRALAYVLVAALAVVGGGCTGGSAEYCDLACDCYGYCEDELIYNECLIQTDEAEQQAIIYTCEEEADAYLACFIENAKCEGEDEFKVLTHCDEDGDCDCEEEEEDYIDCLDDNRDENVEVIDD